MLAYKTLIIAALWGIGAALCPVAGARAAPPDCGAGGMLSDFQGDDVALGFAATQLQGGEVSVIVDPLDPTNRVATSTAGPKGRKVGKAGFIHRFEWLGKGAELVMGARILIPEGSAADSVILMDLECAECGLDTNPGIRLYLRDGRLRVDRSKIGLRDPFYPTAETRIEPGTWHDLIWRVTIGVDDAGQSQVVLNGQIVGDARGTTVLTQEIVSKLADIKVREGVDRFQVGLTANSNASATSLLLDDVWFCAR